MFTSHLIPLLAERFPRRLRVLALFRHPLITAASHALRGMYHPWPHWSFFELANITPFDPGMLAPAFTTRWSRMTPFERNLYRWVEYVLLWERFQLQYPATPVLTIRSEDLFAHPERLTCEVAAFAGLTVDVQLEGSRRNELEGKSPRRFGLDGQWRARIAEHPELDRAASLMGYRLDDERVLARMRKYERPEDVRYEWLRRIGYFPARGYVRRITGRRFWRNYSRWKALGRSYPHYFRQMYG